MSGIVAVVDRSRAPVDPAVLERLMGPLLRSAPDGHRSWQDAGIGLGHALLTTTAESKAERQPSSLDGRAWVTADARIDGRSELIRALEAEGRRLQDGETDDRLILHAYRAWGERCAEHLIGDFAFVIWDAEHRRLFCACDQLAVRPLYYAHLSGGLVLSNALYSLRAHPAVSGELDERAIGDFLLCGRNMDTSATIFAGIRALPPAHTLTWSDGQIGVRRYWALPDEVEIVRRARAQDYVERFASVFEEAVSDRVRTDAVGAQLSGGLDSSSIVVTAHRLMRSRGHVFDLRAYTVVFEWLVAEEERRYADQVTARLGLPVEHVVAEEYLTRAPDPAPAWVFPEPWGIAERSPDYEVLRRVSRFGHVMLNGLGGDQLLATGQASRGWRDVGRAAARDLVFRGRLPRFGLRTAVRRRLRRPSAPALPDWINPAFARRIELAARQVQIESLSRWTSTRQAMLGGSWVDMFRSAHAPALGLPVQIVFPFFDLRLIHCVLETPPIPWRADKRLLREAMRGALPEAIRLRPKTSLYRAVAGTDEQYPLYRLARRAETRRWRERLIRTPAIAEFLDVSRALALIEAPPPSAEILATFERCIPLAQWLHQQPPGDSLQRPPSPERIGLVGRPVGLESDTGRG